MKFKRFFFYSLTSLFTLCCLCVAQTPDAFAAPTISIAARYQSSNRLLVARASTNSEGSGCRIDLYGSDSVTQINRQPTRGAKLLTFTTPPTSARLVTDPLPLIKRSAPNRSSKIIYLRAQLVCGSTTRNSSIIRIPMTLPRSGGVTLSNWYKNLQQELKDALATQQVTPTPTPTATPTVVIPSNLTVTRTFTNLSFNSPIEFVSLKDGSGRNFVVEQGGKIFSFSNDPNTSTTNQVIDLSAAIATGGERGLLGLAFHPNFPTTPYMYVNYTRTGDGATIVSRFTVDNATTVADPGSELIFLTVAQPAANHNGGKIAFSPIDSYLYIAMGDGGGSGDPQGNGQNLTTLLGKILRIDVNTPEGPNNYTIPPTNPFKGNTSGYKEEIYAYGLRNPWKFSFDTPSALLFAADVGQGRREEISIIESGKNYGWNRMEGSLCYPSGDTSCDMTGLTLPIHEYDRTIGQSITGGYVYRGTEFPILSSLYIYGDFVSGKIFGFHYLDNKVTNYGLVNSGLTISSFGIDQNNEIRILNYSDGGIYKFSLSN